MRTYVNQPEQAKAAITDDGWYLNLGDVGFYFGQNGRRDLYWQSRDSQMLIRGGANYAFEQVNAELSSFLAKEYPVLAAPGSFSLAVCGIRVKSEHEDECCVMIELLSEEAKSSGIEQQIMESFINRAKKSVTKGAKVN
jgi:hypothetical protein